MKLLICDKADPAAVAAMRRAGIQVDEKLGMSSEELPAAVAPYDALVVRSGTKVTAEVIDAATHLRLIIRGGVGLDNVDLDYAKEKAIFVSNTASASAVAISSMTFFSSMAWVVP